MHDPQTGATAPPAPARAVGIVGLGAMGMGIARTLLRKGFEVHACDLREAARDAIAQAGARVHESPAQVAAQVAVLMVVVVDAAQTEAVLFGPGQAAAALAPGSVVIASSTVAPDAAERLGARLAEAGLRMIDAPLSGGAARAATGELTLMASGEPSAFDAAADVLAAIAARVYRLGDAPGNGSKVKMINQLLAGVHIAAATEAMALGIRAGIDPAQLYEVISNSAGASWMFQNRVPHILAGDYTPLSAVDIFVKDLGIVLDSARRLTFPLPLASAAHQMYLATSASGLGKEDDSAVIKMFQRLTGIDLPQPAP
jgi:putative dehydrogenase